MEYVEEKDLQERRVMNCTYPSYLGAEHLPRYRIKKYRLLRFAVDNINIANPSVSAVFEHVGLASSTLLLKTAVATP